MDHRFRLLSGGYRTAVRRHQTLAATIDWTYELLSEPERALYRGLSVFAGGWSLPAAEAVGGPTAERDQDVSELLDQVVRKSTVVVDEVAGVGSAITRYRFLETIRQYAEEKLLSCGEAEPAPTRHAEWYLRLAEEALDGVESADQVRWWHCLEMELDNLRAALTWFSARWSHSNCFKACSGAFDRLVTNQPSLVVVEDVHWADDPASTCSCTWPGPLPRAISSRHSWPVTRGQ